MMERCDQAHGMMLLCLKKITQTLGGEQNMGVGVDKRGSSETNLEHLSII